MPKDKSKSTRENHGTDERMRLRLPHSGDDVSNEGARQPRQPPMPTLGERGTTGGENNALLQQSNGAISTGETSAIARLASSDNSLFASASNFEISGGNFTLDSSSTQNRTSVTINLLHGHSIDSVYAQNLPPFNPTTLSGATGPSSNVDDADKGKLPARKASSDIYFQHLSSQQRGYPLWIPESNHYLPIDYRRQGVSIGDVGMLTSRGSFDYLFNVFLSRDHPFNDGRIPPDFSPLSSRPDSNDIHAEYVFQSNSYVASHGVTHSMCPDSESGMAFHTSPSEGAILAIPDGAHSENLESLAHLRKYIGRNIKSWYLYANGIRGRELSNGDLRIVIGTDKTTAWGMAAFGPSNPEASKDLIFKQRKRDDSAPGIKIYGWDIFFGSADLRAGPNLREVQKLSTGNAGGAADTQAYENQCIFVRTLNPMLQDDEWAEIMAQLRVPASSDSCEEPIISDSQESSVASRPSAGGTGSQGLDVRGVNQFGLFHPGIVNDRDAAVYEFEAPTCSRSHPSKWINEAILQRRNSAPVKVVITSDFDWISVLTPADVKMPNPHVLTERVMALHEIIRESDGLRSPGSSSSYSVSSGSEGSMYTPPDTPTQSTDSLSMAKELTEFKIHPLLMYSQHDVLPENATPLVWDLRQPPDSVRLIENSDEAIAGERLLVDATRPSLTSLTITCGVFPADWPITIKQNHPITVADVLHAIYDGVHRRISQAEWDERTEKEKTNITAAFKERCNKSQDPTATRQNGILRIDCMLQHTSFAGLSMSLVETDTCLLTLRRQNEFLRRVQGASSS